MAQVFHFGPYYWISFPGGLPPGAQHSWSWGPNRRIHTVRFGCHGPPRAGGDRHYHRGRAPTGRNNDPVSPHCYGCPLCPCIRSQRGFSIGPLLFALAYRN